MMFKTLEGKECYIEKALANVLDRKVHDMMFNKMDNLIIIQGNEGSAKSYFAKQIASYVASKTKVTFGVKDIHFNTKAYIDSAENGQKFQVNILDESRADLYRASSTSKTNKKFTNFLSFCRSMQQFHIIILPRWDDLDKYVCLHRASMIVTTYMLKDNDGHLKRGFFYVSGTKNTKKLNELYIKKYSRIPENLKLIRGKFPHTDVIDEEEYDAKKEKFRKQTFKEDEEKKEFVLTPRQKEVLASLIPTQIFKKGEKDYEVLKRLVYMLRRG